MNCKEIVESKGLATELIKSQNNTINKLIVAIFIMSISLIMAMSYIMYDRYLDSKIEVTATETEVIQDCNRQN